MNTESARYYVSFGSDDSAKVSQVCREMKRRGIELLYDSGEVRDDKWPEYVSSMIERCQCVILFVTKGLMSRENRFVRNEYYFAEKAGKKIYAVMLDDVKPDDVSEALKKWFSRISSLTCIRPAPDATPAETVDAMDREIHFAAGRSEEASAGTAAAPEAKKPAEKPAQKPAEKPAEKPAQKPDKKPAQKPVREKKNSSAKAEKAAGSEDKPETPAGDGSIFGFRKKTVLISALIAAAVLLIGAVSLYAVFRTDDPADYSFEILEDGATVTSLENTGLKKLRIPRKAEGKPVVMIGESAFSGYSNFTEVTVPSGVKEIGSFAFSFCDSLREISIPGSVKVMGESVFADCPALEKIDIPGSVTAVAPSSFIRCTSLRSVNLPKSVTSIGESAFLGCTSLERVSIPDSVTVIEGGAFEGCESLAEIRLPDKLAEISYSVFDGCTGLTSVEIPPSVSDIGDYAFSGCTSLKKAVIPDSVQNIVDTAFSDCPGLTIYGKPGSAAEEYARTRDIPFKSM